MGLRQVCLASFINFIEMPQGSYYRFEIERTGAQDEYVYITPQGVITEVRVYHK